MRPVSAVSLPSTDLSCVHLDSCCSSRLWLVFLCLNDGPVLCGSTCVPAQASGPPRMGGNAMMSCQIPVTSKQLEVFGRWSHAGAARALMSWCMEIVCVCVCLHRSSSHWPAQDVRWDQSSCRLQSLSKPHSSLEPCEAVQGGKISTTQVLEHRKQQKCH